MGRTGEQAYLSWVHPTTVHPCSARDGAKGLAMRDTPLQVLVLSPDARTIEGPNTVWITWGIGEHDSRRMKRREGSPSHQEKQLCRQYGDAAIVKVISRGGKPVELYAWKGLTGCHEIFHTVSGVRSLVIADHFRNIVAEVPVESRAPSPEALTDHFLFRSVPAPGTMCAGIKRLGRGERLHVDLRTWRVDVERYDRAENIPREGSVDAYLDRLESGLGAALKPFEHDRQSASFFSGGADSTLIQSYLPETRPVHYVLPRYEREFERTYGDSAAACLGLQLEKVHITEDDFLERLVRSISVTGLPSPHLQFVFFESLFCIDAERFVIGEQGDALFGIAARKVQFASYLASRGRIRTLRALAPLVPSARRWRRRWLLLPATAERLMRELDDPQGYANQMGIYADEALLASMFGHEAIEARLIERMANMKRIVSLTAPSTNRFLVHLEAAQMIDYLTEDMMMYFRHLAHGSGKSISSPFLHRETFDAALSVPVSQRYVRRGRGKYLIKELLRRRVPDYPADQRKGYSAVSFESYFADGPLRQAWDRYPLPARLDPRFEHAIRTGSSVTTWKALTLSIWEREIMGNRALAPLPGTTYLTFEEATSNRSTGTIRAALPAPQNPSRNLLAPH